MTVDEALAAVKAHRGTVLYGLFQELLTALIEQRKEELLACSTDRHHSVRGAAVALRLLQQDLSEE